MLITSLRTIHHARNWPCFDSCGEIIIVNRHYCGPRLLNLRDKEVGQSSLSLIHINANGR